MPLPASVRNDVRDTATTFAGCGMKLTIAISCILLRHTVRATNKSEENCTLLEIFMVTVYSTLCQVVASTSSDQLEHIFINKHDYKHHIFINVGLIVWCFMARQHR